ncbi:transporter substrate-binding domain-containing protein [Chitinimonas lacunae]|uniref:Transporter substrate-binding domain-containing protein n=1 Tax=Chitinimonas lacunae TaxID=1963018 RepID=A0ABV8MXG2_9NEIS
MSRPSVLLSASLLLAAVFAQADQLDDIKARGQLVAAVIADAPPFGSFNADKTVSGYDIDFASAIAKKIGVKLVVRDVQPSQRIPYVKQGQADIAVATLTKTSERAKEIDFSLGYFVTGQKFLVRRGKYNSIESLTRARIGVAQSTTSEAQLRKELPNSTVVLFPDNPEAIKALVDGQIDAVTTDEPVLAGLLAKLPNRGQFEIPEISISTEAYGIGIRKGEKRLQKLIDETLLEMEQSGEAERIFNRWFGPNSSTPLTRIFRIRS